MSKSRSMQAAAILPASLSLVLIACGGGGSTSGQATPVAPVAPAKPTIASAMLSGSPAGLTDADRDTILEKAIALSTTLGAEREQLLRSLYTAKGVALDQSLHFTGNSITLVPLDQTAASPFMVSDKGRGMAAIAKVGSGRAVAYGADVLGWMAGTTTEQQHFPLFERAFRWAVTGNPDGSLPAILNVVAPGYNANNVKALARRLGVAAQDWPIKLTDGTEAFKAIDLVVIGQNVADDPKLTAQVRQLLEAGKPVLYLHSNWYDTAQMPKVLEGMNMRYTGYNYWESAVDVTAGRTLDQSLAQNNTLGALAAGLQKLRVDDLKLDLASDHSATDAFSRIHGELETMQRRGVNPFARKDGDLYKLLVLWADLYRPGINYGAMDKAVSTAAFLRTYASDSWLVFNRAATTTAKAGLGDYMPKTAQDINVNTDWEELEVTVPQTSGTTLVGRAAIPAKGVQVQVVDAAGATGLSLQTSLLRTAGNPLTEDRNYARPRRPHSFAVPLALEAGTSTDFITPFGGPLMMGYSGAKPGSVIRLRIRGGAPYAHFDFSNPDRPMTAVEKATAEAALDRGDFGWQTAKFVGGEIQQTMAYAKAAMGTKTPEQYISDIKKYIFDTNHWVNGYNNIEPSAEVSRVCAELGWNATSVVHAAPGVQHFVGYIATCGYLCSGNPVDAWVGVDLGWGWAHELGHNTVQRVMTLMPDGKGCGGECNNNILASAQMVRLWADRKVDNAGWNYNHIELHGILSANRATGMTGEPLRADMQARLWDMEHSNAMQAVHAQLGFLYGKHRLNLAKPTPESLFDFYSMLTKGDRLVAHAWDSANKAKYGMGRFADNKISNPDLVYVLSSRIIGKDLRDVFAMYGLPLTATALESVADLHLPLAPLDFYAQPSKGCNKLEVGQWISLPASGPLAPYPYQ